MTGVAAVWCCLAAAYMSTIDEEMCTKGNEDERSASDAFLLSSQPDEGKGSAVRKSHSVYEADENGEDDA